MLANTQWYLLMAFLHILFFFFTPSNLPIDLKQVAGANVLKHLNEMVRRKWHSLALLSFCFCCFKEKYF